MALTYTWDQIIGYESCDPRDTACVSRNAAAGVANNQSVEIDRANIARANCNQDALLSPERPNMCDTYYPAGWASLIPAPNVLAMNNPQVYAETFMSPEQAVYNLYTPNDAGGFTYHTPDSAMAAGVDSASTIRASQATTSQQLVNRLQKANASNPANGNMPVASSFLDDLILGLRSVVSPRDWGTVVGSGNIAAIVGLAIVPSLVAMKVMSGR